MAIAIHVPGPTRVWVDTGPANAWELLGYSRNGIDIDETPYQENVAGDENGGDAGPPIEIVMLGETARLRCEMNKYDTAVMDKLTVRVKGGTIGHSPTVGTKLFGDGKTFKVWLDCTLDNTQSRVYQRCSPLEPSSVGKGARSSTYVVPFNAYKDGSSVLYTQGTPAGESSSGA